MFQCDICKTMQPAGTPQRRVAAAVRGITYLKPGGNTFVGNEVAKELTLCPTCPAPTVVDVGGVSKEVYHDPHKGRKKVRDEDDRQRR